MSDETKELADWIKNTILIKCANPYGYVAEMRLKSSNELIHRSRVTDQIQAEACVSEWQRRSGRKKFTYRVVELYER